MANIEAKIVLTGGPCAGKTTALTRIEEYFTELGYKVYIVSESATELIKGGIKCFGNKAISTLDFQELILNYQIYKENMYIDAISRLNTLDKCLVIFDRGVIDNNAYITNSEFDYLVKKNNYTKLSLLDRYDMVIHLVTAALGASEFYTLENNNARSEGVEEAISLDYRTLNAWRNHSNLKIVDNSKTFEDKMNLVISLIENQIGINKRISKQCKYLVDVDVTNISLLADSIALQIEQIYLGSDNYEKRLRKRTLDGDNTYYFTVQKKAKDGISTIFVDKKIDEKEYYRLLSMYDDYRSINKMRYNFIYNNHQYKLDIFEDGICILESESDILELPNFITIREDITNNEIYYNNNLARKKTKKKNLSNK